MIAPDGRACLCDFGLSIILDGKPTGFTSEVFAGTFPFFAPELLESDRKTVETDIYALACTCAEVPFSCRIGMLAKLMIRF